MKKTDDQNRRAAMEERKDAFEKKYLKKKQRADGRYYNNSDEIRWGKLDNAAHLFPVIAEEGMSNVFRLAAVLYEEVDRELLQRALDIVLPKFVVFNSRLRQGMFWYYFEENGKESPRVVEENEYPCQYIEQNRNRDYMFRVTYYKNRINLEVFHVLTDGVGGFGFLKELVYQYLRLAHRELSEKFPDKLSSRTSLNTEDSFLENFKKTHFGRTYKKEHAYLLKGSLFPKGKMGVIHGYMPVDAVKAEAKKYGASLNEYMISVFIWSVYQEYLRGMPSKKPITVSVPVDLRSFFDSVTSKNFFAMVTATFHPKQSNQPFEDVVAEVKSSLREQITKEHLEDVLSHNVTGEKVMILRTIPLIFKKPGLRGIYQMAAKANSATVTNVGRIEVLPEYEPYIKNMYVMLSRSKGQNLKMALASYRGTLTATITSVMKDTRLQHTFFKHLTSLGIPIRIESNGVYYE